MTDIPDIALFEPALFHTEALCIARTQEARESRESIVLDVLDVLDSTSALAAVRSVVAVLDRVDVLRSDARRIMGIARRMRDRMEAEAEERADEAQVSEAGRRIEYQSAEDRRANSRLSAIKERRDARMVGRALDVAKESYEQISDYSRQLNHTREDLRSILNVFRFENSLDR